MIRQILLVALGGSLGSVARYLCHRWMLMIFPHAFPVGTFLVNITGCFLIGLFWGLPFKTAEADYLKLFLMTGLCGGFTTFSAFTLEGIGLIRDQKTGLFLLYVAASVLLGLVATWAGMRLVRI